MTRSIIIRIFLFVSLIYFLGSLQLAIWWDKVHLTYSTKKGEEYLFFIEYLLYVTLAYYIIQTLLVKRVKYLLTVFIPLISVVTTILLGMVIVLVLPFEETFVLTISVYCTIYIITNFIAALLILTKMTTVQNK